MLKNLDSKEDPINGNTPGNNIKPLELVLQVQSPLNKLINMEILI